MEEFDIDLNDFIRYCESRGDDSYDYQSISKCAIAQYLKDVRGWEYPLVTRVTYTNMTNRYYHDERINYKLPAWFDNWVSYHTNFDELAKDLRKYLT